MIDFSGLPFPDDAPEPGACWRLERPEEGLGVLVLDPPHRKLAVLDLPVLRDLDAMLDEIERDKSLTGLVITGREPLSFAAGADVKTIERIEDTAQAGRLIRGGQALFERIARLSRHAGGRLFTVAAVGGPVPGGACELSLACDRILLADHPKSRIGLPEVLLGIAPGWGGTQRLPRRLGVPQALGAILAGKLYPARKAKKMGLVDRLTPPEYLLRIASDLALGRKQVERKKRGWASFGIDKNPLALAVIKSQARKQVLAKTGGHYPAPLVAIDLVTGACTSGLAEGLEREAAAIEPLAANPITKRLVGIFLLSEEAKKIDRLEDGERAPAVERAGVVGAGVMGGGIAGLMAMKGVDARLSDLSQDALDAAQLEHRAAVLKAKKRRRLERHQANGAIDRLEVTTSLEGFARCALVVEAVVERLDVKRQVFTQLASQLADDAILATNTSSLSVSAIAEGIPNPERVVGLHFFNPVPRMPLVEIVRGKATSDAVVARAARLALDLGKTPVVVADVAGFLVNRLLGPYLDEALRLYEEGVEPERADRVLKAFGMPMGPFELLDEVGLDIASHAARSLEEAYGERMAGSEVLKPLVEAGSVGKKAGKGIYLWKEGKGSRPEKAGLNPELRRPADAPRDSSLSDEDLRDRCVLAMANEAARCLDEDVVAGPRELDLATVFGMGFPPFHGGLASYLETRGTDRVVARLRALCEAPTIAAREGGRARFEPASFLTHPPAEPSPAPVERASA